MYVVRFPIKATKQNYYPVFSKARQANKCKWYKVASKPEIIFEQLLGNILDLEQLLSTFGHFWEQPFSLLGAQYGKAYPLKTLKATEFLATEGKILNILEALS